MYRKWCALNRIYGQVPTLTKALLLTMQNTVNIINIFCTYPMSYHFQKRTDKALATR